MAAQSRYALVVALGGGGDVIAAYLWGDLLSRRGLTPIVASLAWERFVKDPLPGPRSLIELSGVEMVSEYLGRSTAECRFPCGNRTNQGSLTVELGLINNYLLEPGGGVQSLA